MLCRRGKSSFPQVRSLHFSSQRADVGHLQARLSRDDAEESGVEHKPNSTLKGLLMTGTQHEGETEVVDERLVVAMVTAKGRVVLSLE